MIKRVLNFDKGDWRHIGFLSKNFFIQIFIKFNLNEAIDALYWIKIHLSYDSVRIEKKQLKE